MSSGNIDSKAFINFFGGDKRRTSQSSSTSASELDNKKSDTPARFAGLMNQKRGSTDGAARRASWDEQYSKKGFVGNLWNNFTKGSPK